MVATNANSRSNHELAQFGPYEVDFDTGELRKHSLRIGLREQSFRVLAALLEHPGQMIKREELRQALWGDKIYVDFDNNLNGVVAHLREVLCDSADHPRFIETLPKRGYRFIANVSSIPAEAANSRPRLLVLPFLNLTGDPTQDYYSDAITDEIITALASIAPDRFSVIARTSAMRYKGTRKNLLQIGRDLNVDYVAEGSVCQTGDRTSINVQLVRPTDQAHLFANRYEGESQDVFHMQKSIAKEIARHIDSQGGDPEQEHWTREYPSGRPTRNISAYNEYVQGRYLLERLTAEAMVSARLHFERAIALDPDFALAHIALADYYS
jgi:TolB-like protein